MKWVFNKWINVVYELISFLDQFNNPFAKVFLWNSDHWLWDFIKPKEFDQRLKLAVDQNDFTSVESCWLHCFMKFFDWQGFRIVLLNELSYVVPVVITRLYICFNQMRNFRLHFVSEIWFDKSLQSILLVRSSVSNPFHVRTKVGAILKIHIYLGLHLRLFWVINYLVRRMILDRFEFDTRVIWLSVWTLSEFSMKSKMLRIFIEIWSLPELWLSSYNAFWSWIDFISFENSIIVILEF